MPFVAIWCLLLIMFIALLCLLYMTFVALWGLSHIKFFGVSLMTLVVVPNLVIFPRCNCSKTATQQNSVFWSWSHKKAKLEVYRTDLSGGGRTRWGHLGVGHHVLLDVGDRTRGDGGVPGKHKVQVYCQVHFPCSFLILSLLPCTLWYFYSKICCCRCLATVILNIFLVMQKLSAVLC